MHIVEFEDQDFPALLEAFQLAEPVGRYWKQGQLQLVRANSLLVMVGKPNDPSKIAITPARNIEEAKELALAFLNKQENKGSTIEFAN